MCDINCAKATLCLKGNIPYYRDGTKKCVILLPKKSQKLYAIPHLLCRRESDPLRTTEHAHIHPVPRARGGPHAVRSGPRKPRLQQLMREPVCNLEAERQGPEALRTLMKSFPPKPPL